MPYWVRLCRGRAWRRVAVASPRAVSVDIAH